MRLDPNKKTLLHVLIVMYIAIAIVDDLKQELEALKYDKGEIRQQKWQKIGDVTEVIWKLAR